MKNVLNIISLLFFISINSQTIKMKKIEFENIIMYSISEKEMKDFLKNQKGVLNKNLTDIENSCNVYNLNNGKVIYEMVKLQSFLFDSENDLQYFLKRTVEIANNSVKRKFEIKDEDFIDKRALYIQLFTQTFDISLDFKNIEDLRKIDKIFKEHNINNIIPKYNYSLVAIVGEFLKSNLKNVDWKSLKVSDDTPVRYVIYGGENLQDPSSVLENVIYNKSNFKKNIAFYKTVKSILDYAGVPK